MKLSANDIRALALEQPDLLEALIRRLEAAEVIEADPGYIKALHPKQRAFVQDPSPRKAALCGRRAGKSRALAAWFLEGARKCPDQMSLYIALSRNNARGILEKALREIDREFNLGLRFTEKDSQIHVVLPNGHVIWLAGCKDSYEIEKFRGYKFLRIGIDESASYGPYLRPLVTDVLEPTLVDLNGQLAMVGSPGVIPAGPFFEVTEGGYGDDEALPRWETHRWTIEDNPFIPHAVDWLEKYRISRKWKKDHPTYLREWMGQWVRDEGALVYPYDNRNIFSKLDGDPSEWRFSIGLDVGFEDSSAFVVGAWKPGLPEIYIVEAFKKEGLIPSAFAAEVERLMEKYNTRDAVIDSGGIGKGYKEELFERWGIYVEKAKKNYKRAYIEVVRGELLSGNVKVQPRPYNPKNGGAGSLLDEWSRLVWDVDREGPDNRFEDHAADAALYLIRHIHSGNRPVIERVPDPPHVAQAKETSRIKHELAEKIRLRRAGKSGLKRIAKAVAAGR